MNLPKLAILDRDGTLNFASKDPSSPLYYILSPDHLILKPGVLEAVRLLNFHNIPMVLATKQRCVSKGLLTRDQLFQINERLEFMLGVEFKGVYVEEVEETKAGLYQGILEQSGLNPDDIVVFDDSEIELNVAFRMGIHRRYDGTDLLKSVQSLLQLS